MKNRRSRVIAVGIGALMAVAALPATAEVIVLSAKGSSLTAGQTLADTATIDLPAGATAEVLLPSGAMKNLTGPSKTPVRSLTGGAKPDTGLFNRVTELVSKPAGSESAVGAVRAARPVAQPAKPMPFSWTSVPIDADGDFCVEKGATLALVRGASDKPQRLTLVDVAASTRVEVSFEAGKPAAAWPDALAPKVGTYAVIVADRPMKQLRLRLIAPLPDRSETLRVLHGQRCDYQMRAFLQELTQVAAHGSAAKQ
ncbi:MAG: hypothetical protein ACOYLQ_13985 [Hyphomicrobiaceae bacterium]